MHPPSRCAKFVIGLFGQCLAIIMASSFLYGYRTITPMWFSTLCLKSPPLLTANWSRMTGLHCSEARHSLA